jgi:hypothetical protein
VSGAASRPLDFYLPVMGAGLRCVAEQNVSNQRKPQRVVPVKVCTFNGNHTPSVVDDGSNGGDDGLKSFIPPLAWKFTSRF